MCDVYLCLNGSVSACSTDVVGLCMQSVRLCLLMLGVRVCVCVCMCVCLCNLRAILLLSLHVTFVDFVSLSLSFSLTLIYNAVLSALMTHIPYLQSLDNPGSAGSGTNDFFQTPDESRRVREVVRGMGKMPQ